MFYYRDKTQVHLFYFLISFLTPQIQIHDYYNIQEDALKMIW